MGLRICAEAHFFALHISSFVLRGSVWVPLDLVAVQLAQASIATGLSHCYSGLSQ